MYYAENYELNPVISQLLEQVPYAMDREQLEQLFHVAIVPYGYVHDTGFRVVLTERRDLADDSAPEKGEGWATFDRDFAIAVSEATTRWQYANNFGYH